MNANTAPNTANNDAPSIENDYCCRSIVFAARLVLQRQLLEINCRLEAWLAPHHFACPEQSIRANYSGKNNGVLTPNVM